MLYEVITFKLTRVAGAYLGGDEKNEMITRIYGIAFFDKKELNDYIKMLEEAKKRDHRKLGTELELFTFNDDIGVITSYSIHYTKLYDDSLFARAIFFPHSIASYNFV